MIPLLGDRTLEAAESRAKREQIEFARTFSNGMSMTVVPEVVAALNEIDRRLRALEHPEKK